MQHGAWKDHTQNTEHIQFQKTLNQLKMCFLQDQHLKQFMLLTGSSMLNVKDLLTMQIRIGNPHFDFLAENAFICDDLMNPQLVYDPIRNNGNV